ncbi:MAG: hypothetical protein V3R86_05370 [Candidatus Hydrothermarchaeaceae archaeon]
MTNRRIFFYGAKLLKKNKYIVFDFQIDSVVNISTKRNFIRSGWAKNLNIETVSDNAIVSHLRNVDSWVDAIRMANITISKRPQTPPVIEAPQKPRKTLKQCPSCGGKFSEINFYKLKAGNDVECDFCGEIIES